MLANLESPAQSARLGHASVVRLFVQNVRLENLKTSRPAVELAKPPPEGVQLVDDSETHYATVYEKIPIASDAEGNEYTVSVRIKPGNSELMLLVLSTAGEQQPHVWDV